MTCAHGQLMSLHKGNHWHIKIDCWYLG